MADLVLHSALYDSGHAFLIGTRNRILVLLSVDSRHSYCSSITASCLSLVRSLGSRQTSCLSDHQVIMSYYLGRLLDMPPHTIRCVLSQATIA